MVLEIENDQNDIDISVSLNINYTKHNKAVQLSHLVLIIGHIFAYRHPMLRQF